MRENENRNRLDDYIVYPFSDVSIFLKHDYYVTRNNAGMFKGTTLFELLKMLPDERLKALKKQKRKGYIWYLVFFISLWVSTNYYLNIILVSVGVFYIIVHQGYFYWKRIKLDDTKADY